MCSDGDATLAFPPGTLATALQALDDPARSADAVLGHNIIAFDRPQLRAAQPNLRLLRKPVMDTLRLNPPAFPRNPCHHLLKHCHDGALLGNRRNAPLLDASVGHCHERLGVTLRVRDCGSRRDNLEFDVIEPRTRS